MTSLDISPPWLYNSRLPTVSSSCHLTNLDRSQSTLTCSTSPGGRYRHWILPHRKWRNILATKPCKTLHRYLPHLAAQKTITGKVHKEVGEHFRGLLGPWAGERLKDVQKFKNIFNNFSFHRLGALCPVLCRLETSSTAKEGELWRAKSNFKSTEGKLEARCKGRDWAEPDDPEC